MTGQPPWLMKKKPGNAAEDAKDNGLDDAQERTLPNKKRGGKAGPNLNNAIARRLGAK